VLVLLLATLPLGLAGASTNGCSQVDGRLAEDSCGSRVSASVLEDAHGRDCEGQGRCMTLSALGDATNHGGDGPCGSQSLGAGDASNRGGALSCGASGVGCISLALADDHRAHTAAAS